MASSASRRCGANWTLRSGCCACRPPPTAISGTTVYSRSSWPTPGVRPSTTICATASSSSTAPLFHHRLFVWHIWDGRKHDGFHALVNYHKLAAGGDKGRRLIESLTYSYLGDWITRQRDGVQRGEGGADDRLAATLELQRRLAAILEGPAALRSLHPLETPRRAAHRLDAGHQRRGAPQPPPLHGR